MYCSLATFTVELNETIKKECTTLIVMEENCLKLSTPVGKIEKQLQKDADQDIDLTGLCNTKTQPSFFYFLPTLSRSSLHDTFPSKQQLVLLRDLICSTSRAMVD